MTCKGYKFDDGSTAIVCGPRPRRRKCPCGRAATLLCDWKVPLKKGGTCDAPLCERCTFSPAPDKDLCEEHAKAYHEWQSTLRGTRG